MGEQNTSIESFITDMQALWSAEKQLTEAMPVMIQRATNLGLKKSLALHLTGTDQHKEAIRGICFQLGYPHDGEENSEVKQLLSEGERAISTQVTDGKTDAAIIAGAIRIEHYEIERYEAVSAMAKALGYDGIAQRLRLTLEEERQADARLNFLDKMYVQQSSEAGAPNLALK